MFSFIDLNWSAYKLIIIANFSTNNLTCTAINSMLVRFFFVSLAKEFNYMVIREKWTNSENFLIMLFQHKKNKCASLFVTKCKEKMKRIAMQVANKIVTCHNFNHDCCTGWKRVSVFSVVLSAAAVCVTSERPSYFIFKNKMKSPQPKVKSL